MITLRDFIIESVNESVDKDIDKVAPSKRGLTATGAIKSKTGESIFRVDSKFVRSFILPGLGSVDRKQLGGESGFGGIYKTIRQKIANALNINMKEKTHGEQMRYLNPHFHIIYKGEEYQSEYDIENVEKADMYVLVLDFTFYDESQDDFNDKQLSTAIAKVLNIKDADVLVTSSSESNNWEYKDGIKGSHKDMYAYAYMTYDEMANFIKKNRIK